MLGNVVIFYMLYSVIKVYMYLFKVLVLLLND